MGIIGLKGAMEAMAGEYADRSDADAGAELLRRLSKKNYIPVRVAADYETAFLREFKRFMGRPCDREDAGCLEITVLGPGCPQCDRLEQEIMKVLSAMEITADIRHVRDAAEIAGHGVMGTPALIINGKVRSVGRVPPEAQLKGWIREASGE